MNKSYLLGMLLCSFVALTAVDADSQQKTGSVVADVSTQSVVDLVQNNATGAVVLSTDVKKTVIKVRQITAASLKKAKHNELYASRRRTLKKYATLLGAVVVMYGLLQSQDYFFGESGSSGSVSMQVPSDPSSSKGGYLLLKPFKMVWGAIKYTTSGLSRCAVSMIPSIFGGMILTEGTSYFRGKWNLHRDIAEVNGFVRKETKIWPICHQIKSYAAQFDIYSKRLSTDLNFSQYRIAIDKFVEDATEAIEEDAASMRYAIASMLRRDYKKQSHKIDELQDYAVEVVGARQRADAGVDFNLIVADEAKQRLIMGALTDMLVKDFERVLAFCEVKIAHSNQKLAKQLYGLSGGVNDKIVSMNKFTKKVEQYLNLSTEELYELSKNGQGLFDLIYEFEQLWKRDFKTLSMAVNAA